LVAINSGVLPEDLRRRCDAFFAAALADGSPIALIVDDLLPQYDRHAGGLGMFHYVGLFREMGFAVVFVPHHREPQEPYGGALRSLGAEVCDCIFDFRTWMRRYGGRIAVAWLSRPHIARQYLGAVRAESGAQIIYCGRDLNFLRMRRRAQAEEDAELLAKAEGYALVEIGLMQACDAVVTFSTAEAERLAGVSALDGKVHVIPAYVYPTDLPRGHAFAERARALFVGGFRHGPNIDGMRWFLRSIWPVFHTAVPDGGLSVAGQDPERLGAASEAGVAILGHVPDLRPLYAAARVSVAPLRHGAGVKGKIVESLAHGVPVVTTSIGAEGMGLTEGTDVLVADDAEDFASLMVALWRDEALWTRLSETGRAFVSRAYGRRRALVALSTILTSLGVEGFAVAAADG
jgi:glycosyltransferase involved in cell wall biosynthesis